MECLWGIISAKYNFGSSLQEGDVFQEILSLPTRPGAGTFHSLPRMRSGWALFVPLAGAISWCLVVEAPAKCHFK